MRDMSIPRPPSVALLLAVGALLTGCSTGPAGNGSTGASSAAPVLATTVPATTGATTPTTPTTPTTATKCTLTELTASLGRTTGEAGQRHTAVVWTNTSDRTCTITGFGGVDLQGPADPTFGPTYSLPRSAAVPGTVRLAPGAAAHTLITWLPPQEGPGWTPSQMAVTPPDETRSATVPWPGGAVLRQDGATRPGTYIDPVAPGAEA